MDLIKVLLQLVIIFLRLNWLKEGKVICIHNGGSL